MDTPSNSHPEALKTIKRLQGENSILRAKLRKSDNDLMESITHAGYWLDALKRKSQQVCELIDKHEPQ